MITMLIFPNIFYHPGECSYVKCERSDWFDWSASCGIAQRESSLAAVPATVKQFSCDGLAQKCEPDTKVEKRTTQCK